MTIMCITFFVTVQLELNYYNQWFIIVSNNDSLVMIIKGTKYTGQGFECFVMRMRLWKMTKTECTVFKKNNKINIHSNNNDE